MDNMIINNVEVVKLSKRKQNIQDSPKTNGCSMADSDRYLKELGIPILEYHQPIKFNKNMKQMIHRWAPYVQGFSSEFVQSVLDQYKSEYSDLIVFDPFTGCGTVPVQAKLNGIKSYGVELNPLLHFISNVKLHSWDVKPILLVEAFESLDFSEKADYPTFLNTEKHFNSDVLDSLCRIKSALNKALMLHGSETVNLLSIAFCSILIDVSNLKRSPCLGYAQKSTNRQTPFDLFKQRVNQIAEDLSTIQSRFNDRIQTSSQVFLENSMNFRHEQMYDLVITSPPYMNGMDYVINYKIEMAWMGFADGQKSLKQLKNEMVVCDNVSRNLISEYEFSYTNDWIDNVKKSIQERIIERGSYRRDDMHSIVHKYFDDMYKIMSNVIPSIRNGGRFIMVIGDSLIADVYIPTDLFIARIGKDLGMTIESVVKARDRRSGQIRSYKLRETILTLKKD